MRGIAEHERPGAADWMQAAGVAAVLFALYASTAPRSVALEDDGLFILSSYFLGIEHPPGYPLFTLIGHLFTYLPFGSVAYRVHLAAGLFGALSGAAAWLCARLLVGARLPAYLAAFGLGASPAFWSQSIVADVYSLNVFFLLVLVYLGLRACPPGADTAAGAQERRLLPAMAFIFGLSLSNHWPLMLLVAPAFLILLWPLREELLKRAGILVLLVLAGLLPYVWMVQHSWRALPIGFAGPLETPAEIWLFLSRAGYAEIDRSVSAGWLDRVKFFRFLGGQLLVQFAVAGTLVAAAGFAVQWRILGRRIGAFLTVAFLMPSAVLLLLLGFDYGATTKHVFHVYPLPAYAIGALWLALGFAWLVDRYAVQRAPAAAAAAALLALIAAVGGRANLLADHDWVVRYAQAILTTLPRNAVVFAYGEVDLAPMAYFHMIENWRPDLTLYQPHGLILGNRLFHPLRTTAESRQRILREMIERQEATVAFTLQGFPGFAHRDRLLYFEVDKSSSDPAKVTSDVPDDAIRFFEQSVATADTTNVWIGYMQSELRRRYAVILARSLPRDRPPAERERRHLELLAQDFQGALGLAEGAMANPAGYSVGAVRGYLDQAGARMPSDATKTSQSRFFHLRGLLRLAVQDDAGAGSDFETALSLWPVHNNPAIKPLEDLYAQRGDATALQAFQDRVKRLKSKL